LIADVNLTWRAKCDIFAEGNDKWITKFFRSALARVARQPHWSGDFVVAQVREHTREF
jgi:hypothetical protein